MAGIVRIWDLLILLFSITLLIVSLMFARYVEMVLVAVIAGFISFASLASIVLGMLQKANIRFVW